MKSCIRTLLLIVCLFITVSFLNAQTTSWTGASNTNWNNNANWTNGIPTNAKDVVFGDASFTGINQPTVNVAASCKSLTIGGSVTTLLTMSKNMTVSGNVTINSNGTISQKATTLTLSGNWINNGTYTTTSNNSKVYFSGVSQQIQGSVITSFRDLRISAGSYVTLNNDVDVSGAGSKLEVYGTLDPSEAPSHLVSGVTFQVYNTGILKVKAALFTDNYSFSSTKTLNTGGSTVDYASTTLDQTVSNSFTYCNLIISGSGTKSLAANLPSLTSGQSNRGNIFVYGGTFDLKTFTANRSTSTTGGTLFVENGAFLKLSGTNNFPTNYNTNTLNLSSTVEYYGVNQTVSAKTYGQLIFSSSSGAAIKTMPGTAFTVGGNFTSTIGAGTSVSYTAAAAVSFKGNVNIGASTTFNGGSYAHVVSGNWVNTGTYTGSTSTVIFDGPSTSLSGSGSHNFYNLVFTSTGITGAAGASINVAGNLSTTGQGQFTHSSGGLLTMTGASKNISGSGLNLYDLTISGTISSTDTFKVAGNVSIAGSFTGSTGVVIMTGTTKNISGAGTKTFGDLTILGSITTAVNFSIATQLNVVGSFTATAGTATFIGTSLLSGTANLFNVTINGTALQLSASSILGIENIFTITSGTLNVSATVPNTVNYNGTGAQSVLGITYNNVTFSNGGTKTGVGGMTVNGNLTIAASTTFAGSTYTHSVLKNWINNGIFTPSSCTIQFSGSSNSTITGLTTFNILSVDKSSVSGTVTLITNQTAATVNMIAGKILTGTNAITITTTRTGNGIILGNITRTHAFTTGVAYAFEGPDNSITFSSVSGVASVTVSVTVGNVSDFPDGSSINREYAVVVPAGTYTATLRLHYEDAELNGNNESNLNVWNFTSTWVSAGLSGNNTTNNYVELAGLTNLVYRWTCAEPPSVIRWNGSVSSNWNTAANWTAVSGSPSTPPSANDIVQIGTAVFINQPTISSAVTVKGITFGSAQATTLTLAAGGSLLTNGNITGAWTGNAVHTINTGNQDLTVNGNLSLSNGTSNQSINLSMGGGAVTILGSLIQKGNASVSFSGTGNLIIGGDYLYTAGGFTPGTGTITYNGSMEQSIAALNYNNLTINKPSGDASLTNSLTIGGNLLLSAGVLDIDMPTITINGNTAINTGTTLNCDGVIINAYGNWTNTGTYIATTGTVNLIGTSNQAVSAGNFNNLVINKTSGTVTLTGNNSIIQDLTITAGTLDLATYTMNRSSSGGTLSIGAGSSIFIGGSNNFPSGFSANILDATSNVLYNGSVSQTVRGLTYGNIQFANGGANPKTSLSSMNIAGNITINAGATFHSGGYNIDLNGNWINSGIFIPLTGTVVLKGTSKTVTGTTTFNNITVDGSYTVTGSDITYNGHIQVTATGYYLAGSGTATVSGDLTNRGTLISTGTTNFTGSTVQTLRLINALLSTSSGIVNFNGNISPVMNSTSSPQFATLNINNTAGINPSVDWTVFVAMNVSSGAIFNGGISKHTIYGSFTNNGTVTSDGTLYFAPSTAKTVALGNAGLSSDGTVEFGGTGQMTITGIPTLFTNVLISNTNVAGISPPYDWNIDSNFVVKSNSIFNAGSNTYTIGGDITSSGTLNGGTSTFVSTSSAGELSVSTETIFNHFTVNGLLTPQTDFRVGGDFTNNGIYDGTVGVLIMTGGNDASIGGTTSPSPIAQLQIEKDPGIIVTQNINLNNVLFLNIFSGILFTSTRTITQDAGGGILVISEGATLRLGGTNSLPGFSGYGLDVNSNVDYAGTTQTVGNAADYGNLLVTAAGNKNALVALTVLGNLNISAGTLATSTTSVTHTIAGNFIMTGGTLTGTNSTYMLNGTTDQTLTLLSNLIRFKVDKSSGLVNLGSNITVNTALTFLQGKINLGSYNFTMAPVATITGASVDNYFIADGSGVVTQQVVVASSKQYPVGTASTYIPVTVALASGSSTDNFSVRVKGLAYGQGETGTVITSKAVSATWVITESIPGGSNATITPQWPTSLELTGYNRTFSRVGRHNGTFWDYGPADIAAAGSDPYTVSRGAITSFGPFAVAMLDALPVTWLSVIGKNEGDNNIISWSTATESNNNYFVIEASLNGTNFSTIGQVNGAVNSTSIQNYSFEHSGINGQVYFYRIRQVDIDGHFSYSSTIKITPANSLISTLHLYPNPVNQTAKLEFSLQKSTVMTIRINDMSGRIIYSSTGYFQKGMNSIPIDVSRQPAGIYTVVIMGEAGDSQIIKFTKR